MHRVIFSLGHKRLETPLTIATFGVLALVLLGLFAPSTMSIEGRPLPTNRFVAVNVSGPLTLEQTAPRIQAMHLSTPSSFTHKVELASDECQADVAGLHTVQRDHSCVVHFNRYQLPTMAATGSADMFVDPQIPTNRSGAVFQFRGKTTLYLTMHGHKDPHVIPDDEIEQVGVFYRPTQETFEWPCNTHQETE